MKTDNTTKPVILVAEDTPIQLKLLVAHLQAFGYEVDSCSDGLQAKEHLMAQPDRYQLIISDMFMPKMDGLDVLICTKAHQPTSKIPFLMLTTADEKDIKLKALEQGADDFITKPFSPPELKARCLSNIRRFQLYQEQIQAIESLNTINREMAAFSHDLKNPLWSILGSISIIEAAAPHDEKVTKRLQRIKESGRTMTEIISNIAEVYALRREQDQEDSTNIQPSSIIKQSLQINEDIAKTKGIILEADVEDHLPEVKGKGLNLLRVINNLISNAIKYTNTDDHIYVQGFSNPSEVIIVIKDQGIGMPQKVRDELFTKSLAPSRLGTQKEKGTGFGLLIVHQIVSNMGGTIDVDSQEGEYTKFTVTLPRADISLQDNTA